MRVVLSLVVVLALAACGAGGDDATGACNICPAVHKNVNTDQCAVQGTAAGCKSASIMQVTDSSCSVGMPAMTHMACVFSNCTTQIDCSKIATF